MSFSNFYKKTYGRNRRRWGYLGLAFFVLVFYIVASESCDQTQKSVEEAIAKSENLKRVNQLCKDLPKPEDFKFISKELVDSSGTTLGFYYKTNSSGEEVKSFYLTLFDSEGWTVDKRYWLNFTKENQAITISPNLHDEGYIIYCAEGI